MTLVKYNPFCGSEAMSRKMKDFMGDFDTRSFFRNQGLQVSSFLPRVDIKEDEKNIYLRVEIAGLSRDDVKVTINQENVLQISGEKKQEEKKEGENYIRVERKYGEFTRSFQLPENVNSDDIKARFENGVLEITLEKVEPAKPKEVTININ